MSHRTSGFWPLAPQRTHRGRAEPGRQSEVGHGEELRVVVEHAVEEPDHLFLGERVRLFLGVGIMLRCIEEEHPLRDVMIKLKLALGSAQDGEEDHDPAIHRVGRILPSRDQLGDLALPRLDVSDMDLVDEHVAERRNTLGARDQVLERKHPLLTAPCAFDLLGRHLSFEK